MIGFVEGWSRPRKEISGSSYLRSGETETVHDMSKRVFQTTIFSANTLGRSILTRKEATKVIKTRDNKNLIELGKQGNIRI